MAPVGPSAELWLMLNKGTSAHVIRPRNRRRLRMQVGGFQSKTKVRWLGSGGGRAGEEVVYTSIAMHPGTEGRQWLTTARNKNESHFQKAMETALIKGAATTFVP